MFWQLTPPRTLLEICVGPKPGKGGGLAVMLAAPPRKTKFAKETTPSNSSKDQVSGGEDNPVGLSMTRCRESRKEAAPRNHLSPRTNTQVGTWNVRTMNETGKTAQIAAEMRR